MASVAPTAPTETAIIRNRAEFIVSPAYDWIFFLFPPMVALGLGVMISDNSFAQGDIDFFGVDASPAAIFIGAMIHAHLFAVFFRSHGNAQIFDAHRARFVLVPIALFVGMMTSTWVLISVSVLATFWDVYHSGLQTFGFARIYDAKRGNDPRLGRRLDWWLNHLLYAGPIVAGVTMINHFDDFMEFEEVGAVFFTSIPAWMEGNQAYFTWTILGAGALFLVYYVYSYWRFHQQGYRISWLKVYLLVSTGLVSIFSWGFNSWGEAFFIINFFHAFQYFGIVWAREKGNMARLFRVNGTRFAKPATLVLFLGICGSYGLWVDSFLDTNIRALWSLTLVVSIMHFWYDSFIWSVQKKQV